MARGARLILLCLHLVVSSQISSLVDASVTPWVNETCDDLCGCVEGVMKGLDTDQICMVVKGYPCHLEKQLKRASTTKNCNATLAEKWFQCNDGTTQCVGGDLNIDDEENCTADGAKGSLSTSQEKNAANIAYLGCETTVGENLNSSVTCVLSRDGDVVGQCVNNAVCLYKKVNDTDNITERVSCPENWVPFIPHCFSPINGTLETNTVDQKDWYNAKARCWSLWESSLLSITYFSGDEIGDLQERGILVADKPVWLGLFRDTDNSSFRWQDNTMITEDQDDWPWAHGHPVSGLNYVYLLNDTLYSANYSQSRRYLCKMKVSKSLSCYQRQPTTVPQTTDVAETSTLEILTTRISKGSLDALHDELMQVRDDVSNYVKQITNNTAVLNDLNTLISISEPTGKTSNEDQSTSIVRSLDAVVDGLAESINGPAKPLVVSTPEIVLKVLTLCADCEEASLGGQLGNQSFSISLPDSVKAAGATLALSTAGLLHEELPATTEGESDSKDEGKTQSQIGSLVSSISLRRWDGESITLTENKPLQLTFSSLEKFPDFKPSCRYWKVSEGDEVGVWSDEGCSVSQSNSTHTLCHITHLTSFAVIMQISQDKNPLPESLDYLTWAGCALSITCLAIMLLIFFSQRMYRADRNIIHMNLALSLMLAQLIFLFGIDSTDNEGVCKTVGICLHFFLLATFFWMLNEGIFLLSKTTSAKTRWLRLPTYFTLGWAFPLVIVGATMAASFKSYDTAERCWLTIHDGGIWAFVGPAAVVIVINVCILVNVIRVFLSLKANMNKKKVERTRIALRAILLTLPLLGCTWLVGLLSFNSDTHVFAFIFVILNSLQGVFIFILYCLLNDEIKKGLRKRLALLQSLSGRTTHTRGSRTTTSGSNNQKSNRLSKTMPQEQEAVKL